MAIKKMSLKSKKRIDMCAREASILKSLKHENVVAFKSLYSFQGEGWLIMQYLNGGTVEQVLQRMELPESVVCFITHEVRCDTGAESWLTSVEVLLWWCCR